MSVVEEEICGFGLVTQSFEEPNKIPVPFLRSANSKAQSLFFVCSQKCDKKLSLRKEKKEKQGYSQKKKEFVEREREIFFQEKKNKKEKEKDFLKKPITHHRRFMDCPELGTRPFLRCMSFVCKSFLSCSSSSSLSQLRSFGL